MKLQIDTIKKIIKIEENVKLNDLIDNLNSLFPNESWKEFTLETNTTISWSPNPIIVNPQPYNPYPYNEPYYPPQYPWITYCATNESNTTIESKLSNYINDFNVQPIYANNHLSNINRFGLVDGVFDVEIK